MPLILVALVILRPLGIGYVTPTDRRRHIDEDLFRARNETLKLAWEKHPERFPKKGPRLWKSRRIVYLNPSDDTRRIIAQQVA